MGTIILLVMLAAEVFFLVWRLVTKNNHTAEKSVVTIAETVLFLILCVTGVIFWGFRYYGAAAVLGIPAIFAIVRLITKKEKPFKISRTVLGFIGKSLLIVILLVPAILFPQYKLPEQTGEFDVAVESHVFTDESRKEEFSDSGENRAVTVYFYYPENGSGKYPLTIFSHGAFGFYESNDSTFRQLASNGYVVASINHPYHAFFDTDAYGRLVTVDPNIINKAMYYNGKDMSDEEFADSKKWLNLRVDDMNFVVDALKAKASESTDGVFSMIDANKIGLFGHSLGGAASVELGRERNDITAVIDVDGTIIGDELAYSENNIVCNTDPYPIPMLDIFGENHYNGAQKYADMYPNLVITKYSDKVQNVVLLGTGHLNMTDLPLFSPALAKNLGTGSAEPRERIETMNRIILDYFNWQLKDAPNPQLQEQY